MSKQPPPAPTASTVGPCPTFIQSSRTPRHWKLTQHHRTTRPPRCEHDIHILNGRLFDDFEGNITCVSNEGRSIVDYIIASTSLFDKFSYFGVDTHDFSDHFPLTCTLKLQQTNILSHEEGLYNNNDFAEWNKYRWKESLKQDFLHKFQYYYSEFMHKFEGDQNRVIQYLQDFVSVFQQAGNLMKTKFNKYKEIQ